MGKTRVLIGVAPAPERDRRARLFDALEQHFPVKFCGREVGDCGGLDALVLPAGEPDEQQFAVQRDLPCFAVSAQSASIGASSGGRVVFGDDESIAPLLRGKSADESEASLDSPLRPRAGDQIRACKRDRVVWLHRPNGIPAAGTDLVSLPLPELEPGGCLRESFNSKRFLSLLPLVHFLQRLTSGQGWNAPQRRACIVLDDLNLRRSTYGCVDFRQLATHAATKGYHAAIGFIPVDASCVGNAAAAVFRENPTRLSLVIHGNNHLYLEMVRDCSEQERTAMLAQALRRVARLENCQGLPVCHVMESPYGVLESRMFDHLAELGYEAATLTPLQCLAYDQSRRLPPGIGFSPVECSENGLCIIPRIPMSNAWRTEVLLAAMLGQPIVIAGHHYDAAGDLARLTEIVDGINELGPVCWSTLTEIARNSYTWRLEGRTLFVRMASRRLSVPVPEGVEAVNVERPWLGGDATAQLTLDTADSHWAIGQCCGRCSGTIPIPQMRRLEIRSPMPRGVTPEQVPAPRRRIWPYVRRRLTEVRDRAYPYFVKLPLKVAQQPSDRTIP